MRLSGLAGSYTAPPVTVGELRDQVATVPWYHTLDLPGGVSTPGRWDLRHTLCHLPIPASLEGQRCLDIGTWDGFFAFEMERRGASEVLAIDLRDMASWDWPGNTPSEKVSEWDAGVAEFPGFAVARAALGSGVERRELSVYDLTPEDVGTFDFVIMGSLLPHLRDPVRALSAVRGVTRGQFLSADVFSVTLSVLRPFSPSADLDGDARPAWWTPNLAARRRMMVSAGFNVRRGARPYLTKRGAGAPPPARGPRAQFLARFGLPHAWLLAD